MKEKLQKLFAAIDDVKSLDNSDRRVKDLNILLESDRVNRLKCALQEHPFRNLAWVSGLYVTLCPFAKPLEADPYITRSMPKRKKKLG